MSNGPIEPSADMRQMAIHLGFAPPPVSEPLTWDGDNA